MKPKRFTFFRKDQKFLLICFRDVQFLDLSLQDFGTLPGVTKCVKKVLGKNHKYMKEEGEDMHFHRLIHNFITDEEQFLLKKWFEDLRKTHGENKEVSQKYLKTLQDSINGWSVVRYFSDTEPIRQLKFSLVENEKDDLGETPEFINEIRNRIIDEWQIPGMEDNSFMQMTIYEKGGFVHPHYDPSPDGYITCRANVFFSTWDGDSIYLDKEVIPLKEKDLFCFAASLYRHKTDPCECDQRIFCSFGFLIPYEHFGLNEDDPRVRLSQRIWNKFINLKEQGYGN